MNHEPHEGNAFDVVFPRSLGHSTRLPPIVHSFNHFIVVVCFGQADANRQI